MALTIEPISSDPLNADLADAIEIVAAKYGGKAAVPCVFVGPPAEKLLLLERVQKQMEKRGISARIFESQAGLITSLIFDTDWGAVR